MPEPSVILVDLPEGTTFDVAFLERLDHPVEICHGPAVGRLCPILAGEDCPKVDKAHGVVFELDLDRSQHRAILKKYQERLREEVPIVVVTTPEQAARYAGVLGGVQVWPHAPGTADLDGFAAEVEAADLSG